MTDAIGTAGNVGATILNNARLSADIARKREWLDRNKPDSDSEKVLWHNNWLAYDRMVKARDYFQANPGAKSVLVRNATPFAITAEGANRAAEKAGVAGARIVIGAPPLPHPDASNQSIGPNLGGADAVSFPGEGATGGSGLGLLLIGGLVLLLLLGRKK